MTSGRSPRWFGREKRTSRPSICVTGSDDRLVISIHGELDEDHLPVLLDVVDAALDSVGRADRVEVDLRNATSVGSASLRMVANLVDAGVVLARDDYELELDGHHYEPVLERGEDAQSGSSGK
jgi:ABC-type transporter Mla MlaB component